jgi:16S rRNA U1498 N3-methylase RsmE
MQQSLQQFRILRELRAIPLCIITAKQEEAELIQRYMKALRRISGDEVAYVDPQHTFWKGTIELKENKEIEFYVTHCTRQAIQTFAVEATSLLGLLKPKYAIHAGVCASLDANIG